jgi:hypothetical protein
MNPKERLALIASLAEDRKDRARVIVPLNDEDPLEMELDERESLQRRFHITRREPQ